MERNANCNSMEKIVEMAKKEIRVLVEDPQDPTFNDYFQSRIIRTKAKTAFRYALKVNIKTALMPAYWISFRIHQMNSYFKSLERLSET